MNIAWLGYPEYHRSVIVGGKDVNLSRLSTDLAVPPGVTSVFPVTRDDPEDAKLTWSHDTMHHPRSHRCRRCRCRGNRFWPARPTVA